MRLNAFAAVFIVGEDIVHDRRTAPYGGDDYVAVDGFGYVRGLVAHGVTDLLDRDGVLAYSALFLAEDAGLLGIIADKAASGVRVRLALGDPDSDCIAERGQEEGIGDARPRRSATHSRSSVRY